MGYSGGTIGAYSASGTASLSAGVLCVGCSGAGAFTQTGGSVSASQLGLASCAGSSGVYNLGGSGTISSLQEDIGQAGTGVFVQSGGTNAVGSHLSLGDNPGSSGTYDLNGGLLTVSWISSGSGSAAFNFGGGTLQASGPMSTKLAMTLTGSDGNACVDTNAYSVTLFGPLSGRGGLTIVESGTLVLTATNTYTGNTLIGGGTLALGSPLALQESTLDTSGSGILSFGTQTVVTLGGLTGPGTLASSNTFSSAVALSVGNNNADTTFSGTLNGPGSLTKTGSGSLILSGENAYTGGTIVDAGTLVVADSRAFPGGTSLSVGAGSTFIFDPSLAGAPAAAPSIATVPEPGTLALLAVALGGVAAYQSVRSRRKKQ